MEQSDAFFLLLDDLLLVEIVFQFDLTQFFFLVGVLLIIALVKRRFSIFDLNDSRGDRIDKIPVVTNDDDRFSIAFLITFQPCDGIDV